ncbi:MAG TPA: AI-2E family transporter, partial [Thermomicrobiales bacterium]|nr:AI-2E family transporter [Thermomicrobiales bacterium]
MQDRTGPEPSISNDLITLAAAVIVIVGMRELAAVLVPVLTAIFFLFAFLPLVTWLRLKGVSPGWSKVIAIGLAVALLVAIVVLVVVSGSQFIDNLPEYEDQLRERLAGLTSWLEDRGISVSSDDATEALDYSMILDLGVLIVPSIAAAAAATLVSLVVFVYALIDIERTHQRLTLGLGTNDPQLTQVSRMVTIVSRYIAIRAVLGALAAVLDTILLLALGVEYALFWGFLSFLMSFIPYAGYWIALIPPMLLALATDGWTAAILVFIGYLLINGAVDSLIAPNLMGRGLDIPPAVTVLSIVFWGAILGPMGTILAMPLTVAFKILLLERSPNARWLALLVSTGDGTAALEAQRAPPLADTDTVAAE